MAAKLEQRYTVLKNKDIQEAGLSKDEIRAFNLVCDKVHMARTSRGAGLLKCLVIEADWPEYSSIKYHLSIRIKQEQCEHKWDWFQVAGEGKYCKKCGARDYCED